MGPTIEKVSLAWTQILKREVWTYADIYIAYWQGSTRASWPSDDLHGNFNDLFTRKLDWYLWNKIITKRIHRRQRHSMLLVTYIAKIMIQIHKTKSRHQPSWEKDATHEFCCYTKDAPWLIVLRSWNNRMWVVYRCQLDGYVDSSGTYTSVVQDLNTTGSWMFCWNERGPWSWSSSGYHQRHSWVL